MPGLKGDAGLPGRDGFEGIKGERGPSGLPGAMGFKGKNEFQLWSTLVPVVEHTGSPTPTLVYN